MRCPFCGHDDSQVKDSRPSEDNSAIRRRRHCPECGGRFTTFERVQLRELIVVKKNGRREAFDRDKLERSINHALRKRPVERERVDRMITGIVRRLESMGENEIPANMIGELVMQALASLDKVAYVRFASVYRNFRETRDFETLIGELEGDDPNIGAMQLVMNILIVEARYHPAISDALADGATKALQQGGAHFDAGFGSGRAGNSRRHRAGGARGPFRRLCRAGQPGADRHAAFRPDHAELLFWPDAAGRRSGPLHRQWHCGRRDRRCGAAHGAQGRAAMSAAMPRAPVW